MSKRKNIQKIIESSLSRLGTNTPGLVLLPAVTGMGKSYAAEQIAIEQLKLPKDQRQWKHIIYITPRKDNLPTDLLNYHAPEKQASVVYINRLQDNFSTNWEDVFKKIEKQKLDIDDKIIKKLDLQVKLLTRHDNKSHHDISYESFLNEKFSSAERDFRRSLKIALKSQLGNAYQNLSVLSMNDPKYKWIGKLYPAQIIDEADVVIMSARMAIGPLARINGSARLDDFLDQSLVILDEFDSIKTVMLDYVAEDANQHRYDLIRTLRKLIQSINAIDPPYIFPESTMKHWDILLGDLNDFHEENNLRWHVKLSHELEDASRRFMASDYQFTTYIKGHSRINLVLKPDADKNLHVIGKFNPEDSDQSLISFLVRCRILINRVAHTFRVAAEVRSREVGKEYEFIFEEYFYSICNHFSLDDLTTKTLLRIVQKTSFLNHDSLFSEPFEARTFIQKGLQLTEIIDSPRHSTHSRFQEISLYPIPEAMLLSWCNKAQILGMSATVLRETAIGNFHLGTLRAHLGEDRFISPNEDEHELLRQLHDELFAGYELGKIDTKVIKTDIPQGLFQADSDLINIVGDEKNAWLIFRLLIGEINSLEGDNREYYFARYLRIVHSLCYFRDHTEILSALLILNAHPNDSKDAAISSSVIDSIEEILFKDDDRPYTTILKSRGFSDKLELVDQKLSEGKRVIAFSTYSTIGKGVNIQHVIPPGFRTIISNEYEKSERMDWQMIHIDAPTNLLPSLKYGEPFGVDNLKALLQFEYLVLCGALPYTETWKYFSAIFKNGSFEHPRHIEYFNFTIREVIQALGRLSRTNVKAPSIHILVEDRLLDILRLDSMQDDLSIPEYGILLKHALEENGMGSGEYLYKDLQNNALNITLESEKKKKNLLKSVYEGKEDSIKTYKLLRETLLKHPVVDDINSIPASLHSAYIQLPDDLKENPALYFRKKNDKVIDLSFQYDQNIASLLSEETSGLRKIIAYADIHEFFSEHEYAKGFGSGKWIFNPSLFDIYKGALGEVTGKFLLEKLCGVTLNELPEQYFEQFDFQVSGNETIAIDFKFFQVFKNFSKREFIILMKGIDDKRINAGFEKVFIINIVAEKETEAFTVSATPEYPNIFRVPFILKGSEIESKAIDYLIKELT